MFLIAQMQPEGEHAVLRVDPPDGSHHPAQSHRLRARHERPL